MPPSTRNGRARNAETDKMAKADSDHRVIKKPNANPTLADQGIDKNLADEPAALAN